MARDGEPAPMQTEHYGNGRVHLKGLSTTPSFAAERIW